MTSKNVLKVTITAIVFISAISLGVCAPPPPTPSVPLDGGLSIIIGAGILVAIKKMFFK